MAEHRRSQSVANFRLRAGLLAWAVALACASGSTPAIAKSDDRPEPLAHAGTELGDGVGRHPDEEASESREPRSAAAPVAVNASDTIRLSNLQAQFEAVAKQLAPSVVAVSAAGRAVDCDALYHADQLSPRALSALVFDRAVRTVGTGFVIDAGGYIVTNEHVVAGAAQLWVTTDDHTVYPAVVVGTDPHTDLAVLKVPTDRLRPVRFAADPPRRGQWAIAMGNPFGLAGDGEMSVSVGVVSGVDKSLPKLADRENRAYYDLIQTTAEINPGNSGGPLFNLAGEVIGINTAVVMPETKRANGIGFAIPTDEAILRTIACLRVGRDVVHGYLGVEADDTTPLDRERAGLTDDACPPAADIAATGRIPPAHGTRLDAIDPASPAASAGFQPGDIVTAVNDVPVRDADAFIRTLNFCPIDRPTRFSIRRGGRPLTVSATLRRPARPTPAVCRDTQQLRVRGLLLATADDADGLVVMSIDRTAAHVPANVRPGTLITAVAGQPVTDVAGLLTILNRTPSDRWTLTMANSRDARVAGADVVPVVP